MLQCSHQSRHEIKTIKFSGYLLKRSNNPWSENDPTENISPKKVNNNNTLSSSPQSQELPRPEVNTRLELYSWLRNTQGIVDNSNGSSAMLIPPQTNNIGYNASTGFNRSQATNSQTKMGNNSTSLNDLAIPDLVQNQPSGSGDVSVGFDHIVSTATKLKPSDLNGNDHVENAIGLVASFFGQELTPCNTESSGSLLQQQMMVKEQSQDDYHTTPISGGDKSTEHSLDSNSYPPISANQSSSESSHIPTIPKSSTQPIAIVSTNSEDSDDYYYRHRNNSPQHFMDERNNFDGTGNNNSLSYVPKPPPAFVRMTSAPASGFKKTYPPPPPDYIDSKDGHIWRAKYCVLEDGVLYFYPTAEIGDSPGAQTERIRMASLDYGGYDEEDRNQGSGISSAIQDMNLKQESLAKSPMPRHRHMMQQQQLQDTNENIRKDSFTQASAAYLEKRVALSMVNLVRSNPDYGEKVFELSAINSEKERERNGTIVDKLLLRAGNKHEMNCWIFEIQKSFVFLMKQIAEFVGSVETSTGTGGGRLYERSLDLSRTTDKWSYQSKFGKLGSPPLTPVIGQSTRGTSKFSITELSHGHGRSLRRRREGDGFKTGYNSTFASTKGSSTFAKDDEQKSLSKSHDELGYLRKAAINKIPREALGSVGIVSTGNTSSSTPPASENLNDVDSNNHSASVISDSVAAGMLKEKMGYKPSSPKFESTLASSPFFSPKPLGKFSPIASPSSPENGIPTQKYIPPQKRNQQHLSGSNFDSATTAALAEEVLLEEEEFRSSTPNFYDDFINETDIQPTEVINVGLGGCADPSLISGSICDPEYVKEKASKVKQSADQPFGYEIDDVEIGAASTCGVRDSNEDSYLVINDLLEGLSVSEDDSFLGYFMKRSLFAIFDGHCGNHASRFAAEKLRQILVEESTTFERDVAGDSSSDESVIRELLNKSISRLDKEFCELCLTDEREWYSGTTAIIALFLDEKLFVANVGDCRGIFCCSSPTTKDQENMGWQLLEDESSDSARKNSIESYEETSDILWREVAKTHSPSHEEEKIRIESANGWTENSEQEVAIASQFQTIREHLSDEDVRLIFLRWFSDRSDTRHARILNIWRVCGDLSVSRAIGDIEYKAAYGMGSYDSWKSSAPFYYPANHNCLFNGDLIISTPDINCIQIFGDENVLLLACDGLWDVLDTDEAVRLTRKLVFGRGLSARESVSYCLSIYF